MKKKYLFVCRCPRSGTTAFADVLNLHLKICLSIERYNHKILVTGELHPDLFEQERFLNDLPDDSFYQELPRSGFLRQKIREATWVGEKLPPLYTKFDLLEYSFASENFVVLMIFKNPLQVAESYTVRAKNQNDEGWSRSQDGQGAIADWNKSVDSILAYRNRTNIISVCYSDLFESGPEPGVALVNLTFDALSLERLVGDNLTSAESFFHRPIIRKSMLTEEQRREVSSKCSWDRLSDVSFLQVM